MKSVEPRSYSSAEAPAGVAPPQNPPAPTSFEVPGRVVVALLACASAGASDAELAAVARAVFRLHPTAYALWRLANAMALTQIRRELQR